MIIIIIIINIIIIIMVIVIIIISVLIGTFISIFSNRLKAPQGWKFWSLLSIGVN